MTPYEAAVKMFHREHDRWRQWALFFFGFIASIFVLSEKHESIIPFWFACCVASLLSAIWVCVVQNIRATTHSWMKVIESIENEQTGRAFPTFQKYLKEYQHFYDLLITLYFNHKKHKTWKSVTRLLALLGVVSCLLFFIIGTRAFLITWLGIGYSNIIFSLFLLGIGYFIFKSRKYIRSKIEKIESENIAGSKAK